MRLVCLADTHGQHLQLTGPFAIPPGAVLIHAGDLTARGSVAEHLAFLTWFAEQPHPVKVLIAGNHDGAWEGLPWRPHLRQAAAERRIVFLEHARRALPLDTGTLCLFGSPWTPAFLDWHFMYPRDGDRAAGLWRQVPERLDVLVTHGPAQGILDRTDTGDHAGCHALRRRLDAMVAPPRLHVFGHIHEAAGVRTVGRTLHVNASVIDAEYRLRRAPVAVDVESDGVHVVT